MGVQQFLHAHSQRGFFSRRASGNGSWQNVSCLTSLLQVALDGRPRDLETFDDLGAGYPLINGTKDLLSHLLRVCSHAFIVSPGSFFPQATGVHKLPLEPVM